MKTTRHLDVKDNQPYVKSISIELTPNEANKLIAALIIATNGIKNELIKNIIADLSGQLTYCKDK